MTDAKPKGPYTLWRNYGYDGWAFEDFTTLDAALKADRNTTRWCITKPVEYAVTDVTPEENAS